MSIEVEKSADPKNQNQAFLKNLARYYMDFLETDFHKRPLPKRYIRLRDRKNQLSGINLRKYEEFRRNVWKVFSGPFEEADTIQIKRGEYKSRIKASLKNYIDQSVDELEQKTLDSIVIETFKDFKALKKTFDDNWDNFYEECLEVLKKQVLRKVIQPLSDVLEKPFLEERSLGFETIFELEDDLISLVCSELIESIDRPLIKFYSKGEIEELTSFISENLKKELVIDKLKSFFSSFSSSDLYIEFNELFENKRLQEKEDIYLYFCDINYNKKSYPLFYFALEIEKLTDSFSIKIDPHILINKKAIEYVIQQYNNEVVKTGGVSSLKDRIIYINSVENKSVSEYLQPLISDLSSHFSLSDTIDLSKDKSFQQKSLLVNITNDAYFCLFDRADEALVNDYEELLQSIEAGENPLSEAFVNLINGYIIEEPKSFRNEVEEDWDQRAVSERLVYDSPIALNEEQRKIISSLQKNDCNYVAVQGPPGTGKSHTITAIAFDAIINNSSILILSDKREALDVVENKIVETLNKVRISDDFQNPILRLDKSNFSRIFTAASITKIEQSYKASKQRENEVREVLEAKKEDLQKDIRDVIQSYEAVTIPKIKSFTDMEESLSSKFSIEELEGLIDLREDFAGLYDLYSSIEELVNTNEYEFFIGFLEKHNQNWNSDQIIDDLKLFSLAVELKADGFDDVFRNLHDVSSLTQEELQDKVNQYKTLTSGFFRGFFKKTEIKALEINTNSSFEWASPISLPKDIEYLEKLVYYFNKIKQRLRENDIDEEILPRLYRTFVHKNCPELSFLVFISEIKEVIETRVFELGDTLRKLELDVSLKSAKLSKTISKSLESLDSLINYLDHRDELETAFQSIPDIDYVSSRLQLEHLQISKMTNLIDQRVIDFANDNKATAQTLKRIISRKQKFPKDEFEKIKKAFPCIIAGIRDYAEYIPLEENIFDLVIIDEASQVSIAQAFPAILRGKKVLVLGDNKQFSNVKTTNASNVMNHRYMNDIEQSFKTNVSNEPGKLIRAKQFNIKTSILEFFEFISNYNVMLKKHFRGYRELISFSSKWFYEGHLQAIKIRGKPIEDVLRFTVLEHDGKIELEARTNTNPFEADFIIGELEKLIDGGADMSVGIITPFTNQQKFLSEKIQKSDYSDKFYEQLKLKVMTFDTCQGEERDVIYYSMVASEVSDKTKHIFPTDLQGSLDDEKKVRLQRLNVGFSRAKECMHFVLSKPLDEFEGAIGLALRHYKKQLEKTKNLPTEDDVDPASPMERKVLSWIQDTSFFQNNADYIELKAQFPLGEYLQQLDPGYSHPKYRCDFLLQYTEEGKTTNVIIEYDGFKEHFTNWDDVNEINYMNYYKADDVEREKVLESYGYKFIRINRFNLGKDPIEQLSIRLENLLKKKDFSKPDLTNEILERTKQLSRGEAKECSKCGLIKVLSDFKDNTLQTGIGRICISCKSSRPNKKTRRRSSRIYTQISNSEYRRPDLEEISPPKCPCGASMKLRYRRRDGNPFWGCSRFPNCRNTKGI